MDIRMASLLFILTNSFFKKAIKLFECCLMANMQNSIQTDGNPKDFDNCLTVNGQSVLPLIFKL